MSKNIFKKVSIGMGIAGFALFPLLALAQTQTGGLPGPILTSPNQIIQLLGNVLSFLGAIIMVLSLIMLLYAAVLYLTAGASTTILEKAKSVLIYAIIGIVVAVLAYSVQPFIQNFFITGGR